MRVVIFAMIIALSGCGQEPSGEVKVTAATARVISKSAKHVKELAESVTKTDSLLRKLSNMFNHMVYHVNKKTMEVKMLASQGKLVIPTGLKPDQFDEFYRSVAIKELIDKDVIDKELFDAMRKLFNSQKLNSIPDVLVDFRSHGVDSEVLSMIEVTDKIIKFSDGQWVSRKTMK